MLLHQPQHIIKQSSYAHARVFMHAQLSPFKFSWLCKSTVESEKIRIPCSVVVMQNVLKITENGVQFLAMHGLTSYMHCSTDLV